MQQNNRSNHQRYTSQRTYTRRVDGFSASTRKPVDAHYKRRSNGIIPSNDTEYMIALGGRASRRNEQAQDEYRRSFSDLLATSKQRLPKIPHLQKKKLLPALVVVAALSFGVFGILSGSGNSSVIADQDLRQILEDNGDTPTDKQPYNHAKYQVAPDMPRVLTINKLGVQSRVVRLSARDNSEPKSPQNIYDIGWYENSAKPGDSGAALLIGHKSGAEKNGVFYDLTQLVPGDEFQLELGDGTIKNYQIVKMDTYTRNQVDFQELMQSAVEGRPGLNLLTAVGSYASNADVTQQLAVFTVERNVSSDQ